MSFRSDLGLDPRTQALLAFSLSIMLLVAPFPRLILPVFFSWAVALCGLPGGRRWPLFRSTLLLACITLGIGAWLSGERGSVSWWRPTASGLRLGALQGIRVSALGAVMAWAVTTIPIWRLSQGIERSVRKQPSLHRAVHAVLFPFILAWQMIPGFWDETLRQVEVYRLRSGPGAGGWKLSGYRTLVPGWFNGIAQRAEILAEALTVRGYSAQRPPTPVVSLHLGSRDFGVVGALILLWGGLFR